MKSLGKLHESIEAAGIPIPDGLDGAGPHCRLIGDTPHLTAEQRLQAEAIIAGWNWSEPPPPKPRNVLAEIYMATDLPTRENVWNDILGAMILDRVQSHPDEVQTILDARGVNVRIREEKARAEKRS